MFVAQTTPFLLSHDGDSRSPGVSGANPSILPWSLLLYSLLPLRALRRSLRPRDIVRVLIRGHRTEFRTQMMGLEVCWICTPLHQLGLLYHPKVGRGDEGLRRLFSDILPGSGSGAQEDMSCQPEMSENAC